MQYLQSNHSDGNNMWHFQWCTKYRCNMFKKDYNKNLAIIAITEACKRYNIEIIALNVQQDHIHLLANLPKQMKAVEAIMLIKGFSSYLIFKLIPEFRLRYKNSGLWSRGYFVTTVGFSNFENVVKYIKEQ